MEQSYINWKQSKENVDFAEYAEVAKWCNQSGKYHIADNGKEYVVELNMHPTQEELIRKRIAEFKRQLAQTDYVAVKIAEGCATADEYAEILAMRRAWRAEINALEENL